MEKTGGEIVEQVIRPTGLIDPTVEVRAATNQIDDLLAEIKVVVSSGNRVMVTTLTKRMAEDLSTYLDDLGIRVKYLHSEIDTLERVQIIRDLRKGLFDVLVGINLLREGLDIPEVSLVAILDADREGFLRSETSLIQTIGRAARNISARAILYADVMTNSINRALAETHRRREVQERYNAEHHITPESVKSQIHDILSSIEESDYFTVSAGDEDMQINDLEGTIDSLQREMLEAAELLEFERAAEIRDRITQLQDQMISLGAPVREVAHKARRKKKRHGKKKN